MGKRTDLGGNDYWRASKDEQHDVIVLERTSVPFTDLSVMGSMQDNLSRILRNQLTGRPKVLLDFRHGPTGRNDASFENASEAARAWLSQVFSRVAVLVRTQAGKLQVARLQKSERDAAERAVFTDEAEVWRWLLS